MTAVANPPSFTNLNRPGWINDGQPLNSVNPPSDDGRGANMFMPRKSLQRSSSTSSVSSAASSSSTSTVTSGSVSQPNGISMPGTGGADGWSNPPGRKRPSAKSQWSNGKADGPADFSRAASGRAPTANGINGINGASALHQQPSMLASQNHQPVGQNGMGRPGGGDPTGQGRQPVLYLLSLNGSFERKTITVPFFPDTLRIGRQTNAKTVPTPVNGYFDSKVLSRQHAEIWADANGKIWIRDVKSSNGTFVNGTRLSPENRESDPHELQAQDHLELGIDIVSEDQKTVVHHKVAAKVEHAGFLTPSSNVMDMNFGDLDSSNSSMMSPAGGVSPFRGRTGSQSGTPANNRTGPGNMGGQPNTMAQQRQFWLNPVTTEHIVKKLHTEVRNARLQNQDLARTSQFLNALLSKDDIKNADKPDVPEAPKAPMPNGNVSFRSDGGKTRFSEPPAPPPSQPLPEKPDAARGADVPLLKRAATERQKAAKSSPIRQDNNNNNSSSSSSSSNSNNMSQILLLTEALNNAKKELDSHTARVRDLEEMLTKEREARLHAEDMIQKMGEASQSKVDGSADAPLANGHAELDSASDRPAEQAQAPEGEKPSGSPAAAEEEEAQPEADKAEALAAAFQAKIDSMALEMNSLREQLEAFRLRAEKAEAERDADRKTLAEMVAQLRQRDEEDRRREAERRAKSTSRGRRRRSSQGELLEQTAPEMNGTAKAAPAGDLDGLSDEKSSDAAAQAPSETSAAKPGGGALAVQAQPAQEPVLIQTLPYASMIGVVFLGMGLMAYLNGWSPQPKLGR
ncbi:hypothetical protein VTH06DRAFT_8741 [Thermothelomyces fergusii]